MDKSVAILGALELRPHSLNDLALATGISRPTAHRLAVAMEDHGLVARDGDGRFLLGPRIFELAESAGTDELAVRARPILRNLRDQTGESTQLYQRVGDQRVCLAVADLASGLRDTVPKGALLAMTAGSAAQILLAWEDEADAESLLDAAAFTSATLAAVRRRGWAHSVAEREPGVASVSAPVRGGGGRVVAALSISGPAERLGRSPGRRLAEPLVSAAEALSGQLSPG